MGCMLLQAGKHVPLPGWGPPVQEGTTFAAQTHVHPHHPRPCAARTLQTIAAVVALKPAPQQTQPAAGAATDDGTSGGSGGSAAANGSSGGNGGLTLHDLRAWARDRLPPYQLPRHLKVVEAIPRNAMGKVNKKELRKQLFPEA